MLKIVPKLTFVLACLIFLILFPAKVFATDPPKCNPLEVDINASISLFGAGGEKEASSPTCLPSQYANSPLVILAPDLAKLRRCTTDESPCGGSKKFCYTERVTLNLFACFPPGPTTETPVCPSPWGWIDAQKSCCQYSDYGGEPTCDKSIEPSCPSSQAITFKWNGSACVAVSVAGFSVSAPWDFTKINTCDNGTTGIQSAIGCIPTGDLKDFLGFILKFVFGITGGIILIMLIITSYNILTSAGNPEKVQASKENLVSILSGLILIAFSLILLQTIGVTILQLPGFT